MGQFSMEILGCAGSVLSGNQQKYGTAAGWQKKAIDDIYGGRNGNRPNTNDGSTYIGRGGPQVTGREGYREVGKRCGLDLVSDPELATLHKHQPAILAAFWSWKGLNDVADKGNFTKVVLKWNGGTNGLKDRKEKMAGNEPIINRLTNVASMMSTLENAVA